jgi:hypothetical protein
MYRFRSKFGDCDGGEGTGMASISGAFRMSPGEAFHHFYDKVNIHKEEWIDRAIVSCCVDIDNNECPLRFYV